MQTLTLKYITFKVNDYIQHKQTGYTGQIKKFYRAGYVDVEIQDTAENRIIWAGYKLPCTLKMRYIAKTFKHSPLTLF